MTTETNQPTTDDAAIPGAGRHYELPPLGENPSSTADGTTPGSFALAPRIAVGRCSPRTQRMASLMFDFPQPLGPTTAVMPS